MLLTRTTLAAVALWSAAALPTPSAPVPGPGGVLAAHDKLVAALDAGQEQAAAALFAEDVHVLFLVDSEGQPLDAYRVHQKPGGIELTDFERWLDDGRGGWKTEITSRRADCPSERASHCVLEFERRREDERGSHVRHYRSTSLVTWRDGDWQLFHWHVSLVGAETLPKTSPKEAQR